MMQLTPPVSPRSSTGLLILLIEDNPDIADTFSDLLRLLGHRVHWAATGAGGIAAATTHRPDVIFLDIGLPDMTGYEVAVAIRAQPGDHPPRIIAVTGWSSPDHLARSRRAGIDHHATKPLTLPQLRGLMADLPVRPRRRSDAALPPMSEGP